MSNSKNSHTVVDTNVAIVASYREDTDREAKDGLGLSKNEIENCDKAINNIIKKGGLLLDSDDKIFREYYKHLANRVQEYNKFLKWIYEQSEPRVTRIPIAKIGNTYQEFPNHPKLAKLDPSDKKFIAVACADAKIKAQCEILQATDSKWYGFENDFKAEGINVNFLCKNWIRKKYNKKQKPKTTP